jgi:hypothetical protein
MIYYEFLKISKNYHKSVLMVLFIWVYDIAVRPLPFLEFWLKVPGRESTKELVGAHCSGRRRPRWQPGNGGGAQGASLRTRWCPRLAPRRCEVSRPRRQLRRTSGSRFSTGRGLVSGGERAWRLGHIKTCPWGCSARPEAGRGGPATCALEVAAGGHGGRNRARRRYGDESGRALEGAEGERGCSGAPPYRRKGAREVAVMAQRRGMWYSSMVATVTQRRARGVHRSGQCGVQFWAGYRPNWITVPKAKL